MAHILLIDDDPDMHKIVTYFLRAVGHHVTCLDNGRDAPAEVRKHAPDLVLLDVSMPLMDGVETFELLRSELGVKAPPVVFLTVHDRDNLTFNINTEGCVGFISKPVTSERLQKEVDATLSALQIQSPIKKAGAFAPARNHNMM